MYFKNDKNELFYEPSVEVVARYSLIKITKREWEALLKAQNTPSLEQAKQAKQTEINLKFEANLGDLEGGLEVQGVGLIDCGKQHLTNIQGLIKVLEATKTAKIGFKMYDNSLKELTLAQLKQMELLVIQKGQELYQKKWQLLETLASANSLNELENIAW